MKFSASLAVAGAAVASAAAVPLETPVDYCPVVVKTIGLSWIELDKFPAAETWTVEEAESCVGKSKPDPAQVFPNLNYTTGAGDDNNNAGGDDSYPTDGAHPTASYSASVEAPYPTGYANFTAPYPTASGAGHYSNVASQTAAAGRSSSTSSASASPTGCTTPRVRVEWRNLNDKQRDAYVDAISCLMKKPSSNTSRFPGSRSLYEDLSSLHQQVVGEVHQSGKFLVFHRYYMHIFETLLRNKCAYNGPIVWWDESKDAGNFAKAPMFTTRWFGEMPAGINGRGVCIESGFGTYEPNLGPSAAVNNPHCLSRALDETQTKSSYVGTKAIESCSNAQNYNDYRRCAELTFHAYGHNAIGSVMSNVATSPEDPVFYLHHGYIDCNYRKWQKAGSTRNFEIGGPRSKDDSTSVKPSDVLPGYGLVPDVTIADVLNTENNYLCYRYDSE